MPDFKPLYNSAYSPHWIRSSIRLHIHRRSGASRSCGICPYRAGKLHDIYASYVSGFLSLPPNTWHLLCGIGQDSIETAYHLKPFRYPTFFCAEPASNGIGEFYMVFDFLGLGRSGIFLLWEVFPVILTYQKPPLFLKKASRFVVLWQHALPCANGRCAWPRILVSWCYSKITIVQGYFLIISTFVILWNFGMNFTELWKLREFFRIQFRSRPSH